MAAFDLVLAAWTIFLVEEILVDLKVLVSSLEQTLGQTESNFRISGNLFFVTASCYTSDHFFDRNFLAKAEELMDDVMRSFGRNMLRRSLYGSVAGC